eukprot:sb/3469427/
MINDNILERGKRRIVEAMSSWRSSPPPSPTSTPRRTSTGDMCIRGDKVAPPPLYPRFSTICHKMDSQRSMGLAADIDELSAPCSPSIRHRCYREEPKPSSHDQLRSILKSSRPCCPCRTGKSPDSAYDSSSSCSWAGSDTEDDQWSDEEDDISEDAMIKMAEFDTFVVPYAAEHLQIDLVRKKNAQWNAVYSRSAEPSRTMCQSCSVTANKKSVRHRDSNPQIFTFIKLF